MVESFVPRNPRPFPDPGRRAQLPPPGSTTRSLAFHRLGECSARSSAWRAWEPLPRGALHLIRPAAAEKPFWRLRCCCWRCRRPGVRRGRARVAGLRAGGQAGGAAVLDPHLVCRILARLGDRDGSLWERVRGCKDSRGSACSVASCGFKISLPGTRCGPACC